jgi:hypothetical protein
MLVQLVRMFEPEKFVLFLAGMDTGSSIMGLGGMVTIMVIHDSISTRDITDIS